MRIAFVGAVEGSLIALDSLVRSGMAPGLTVTLPAHAAARHSDFVDLSPLVSASGSELMTATDVNAPDVVEALDRFRPDLLLIIGWSQICRAPVRATARIGCVGFHPAPLPRMRGRAVIPWTILQNENATAATLFWLDEGVDSGPILLQEHFQVAADETARSLYRKHTEALARILPRAVELVRSGEAPRLEQDHSRATYCAKRTPDDGLIDWREPAANILRLVRAVGEPYPGAFTFSQGAKLIIDQAIPISGSERYIGLPGQVQCHTDSGFVVRCGDGLCVHVTEWRRADGRHKPPVHLKFCSGGG
jgi:methionyl-tRNA formyltransferase